MNSVRKCLFLLTAVMLTAVLIPIKAGAQERDKKATVTIEGTVVAESTMQFLACFWHVCGISLIVRLDKPASDKFVIVLVEFMNAPDLPRRGLPTQLVKKAERWKFFSTVGDADTSTQVLDPYWKGVNEKGRDVSTESKLPAWSLLDGAKNEILPFGQSLPSYRVAVGKFKKIA